MASEMVANVKNAIESKVGRKKKGKAEDPQTAEGSSHEDQATSELGASKMNGADGAYENQYIKEIQKQIRNVNKKLSGMAKVDQVINENSGVSLDDLVASKKINADQKAQVVKRPALQNQLTQLEEQLNNYRQIDQEYQSLHAKEKELLQSSHAEDLQKMKDTIVAEQRLLIAKEFRLKLLTLSRYLSAAAKRRNTMSDEDEETEESKAFEGLLSQVYGANPEAVYAAEKLIDGADEPVMGQDGNLTKITFAQVKKLSLDECPIESENPFDAPPTDLPSQPATSIVGSGAATSDPTTVHAGLTELDTNGIVIAEPSESAQEMNSAAPATTNAGAEASNAAAEEQWDAKPDSANDPMAESYEIIPRDPAETETREEPTAQPAGQSWADDVPSGSPTSWTPIETASTTAGANGDGFREVHHGRGGRGHFRGGEGRGGRGFRGDFRGRGRGRGEFRGGRGRGGPRGGGGPGGERGGFRGGRGGAVTAEAGAST